MNANQIVTMVTRMFLRKAVKTGVDASFKHAAKLTQAPAQTKRDNERMSLADEPSEPVVQEGPSREEVRKARRERRAIREKRRERRARKGQDQTEI
ncbi:MAG: hypothetical protein ACRBB0_13475 [Pelagimonas sp.]|uniref:hypothetical protein n=1 Tax=Pelagimonas sp. TaxID=2073170 RepID=UPI003D6A1500